MLALSSSITRSSDFGQFSGVVGVKAAVQVLVPISGIAAPWTFLGATTS